jgi:MFS family permease
MHGLYLLWWVQEKHVSPAAVASIMAAGNVALMLAEVPTGWFADRFGHRASLILGSSLQIVAMLWCWLGEGIVGLTVACLLVAISDAFRSGADQALVYRSCLALDREDDFQRLEARSNAVELGALVGLVLAGGVIVNHWGFAAGWIAEAALSAVGLGIACAMTEPPAHGGTNDATHEDTQSRTVLSVRIALIVGPTACLGAMAGAAAFVAQTAGDTDTTGMTLLVATITLAEAAGSAMATRIRERGAAQQLRMAATGAVLLSISVAAPAAFPIAVPVLSFLVGLAEPLRDTAIQRLAPDDARARTASLASACSTAAAAIALPLAGLWGARRR